MSVDLDLAARSLVRAYGVDPQAVGVLDGTEDDYGDLLLDAAELLDVDVDDDETWQHFQDVAGECRATNMRAWLEHLAAAVTR